MEFEKIYAIDTNIILNDAENIFRLSQNGQNLIVIPETVLDEVDMKKSGIDEINFQAREYTRISNDEKIVEVKETNGLTVVVTTIGECVFYTISKDEYKADKDNTAHNIRNDRKILEAIKQFKQIPGCEEIIALSNDGMFRKRAISLGIMPESLNLGQKNIEYNFIKCVTVDVFPEDNTDIFELNPEHEPMNFGYEIYNEIDGYTKYAIVKNDRIQYMVEEELTKQDVSPLNVEQKFFSMALLDNYYDIVSSDAKAGSGKTLLAFSAAIKLVRDKTTNYNKIVYIRNSVESVQKGEDVGYLSGNDEKFEIYNYPLYDTLYYIAKQQLVHSNHNKQGALKEVIDEEKINEKMTELIERYNIKTAWVGSLRGRTFSDAIIIIDEGQNMSRATMQLSLSRFDKTCRAFVMGSNRQIDNMYVNKFNNGLAGLLSATLDVHDEVNLFAVELQKVLRGPITEFAEKVFS